jgi:probable HAF family extracellular repeat protein
MKSLPTLSFALLTVVAALLGLSGAALDSPLPSYTIINLGTLGGDSISAYGINRLGQVVGYSRTGTGSVHVFLYSNNTGMLSAALQEYLLQADGSISALGAALTPSKASRMGQA